MGEPTLRDIDDYDTLKGEKKRVVWAVIFAGLIMGVVYMIAYSYYDNADENIKVQESIQSIPVK